MKSHYEYVIRVDGQEVWRGKNPEKTFVELKKKNPKKRVSIAWQSDDDLLIVLIG